MSKYNFVFLCLARDCADYLDIFFNFLDTFPTKVSSKIIFGENNSRDNTKKKINDYIHKSKKNHKLLNLTSLNKINDRIERITKGRHLLKNYLIKKKIKSDYVCVMDLDNVLSKELNLNYAKFKKLVNSLKKKNNKLNGISVKSKPYYYDILAFKSKKFDLPNILQIQRSKQFFNAYYLRKKYIYSLQRKINKQKKLMTISSFNGLCLYNYDDYILGDYYYRENKLINSNKLLNEHMKFNLSLNKLNKKHILIDDIFKLKTPEEHIPASNFFNFIYNKIKNFFLI